MKPLTPGDAKPAGISINFATVLCDLDGKELRWPSSRMDPRTGYDPTPGEGDPITLGSVCVGSLQAALEEDRPLSIEEKMKRGDLADYIWGARKRGKPVPMAAAEIAMLTQRIGKTHPLIVAHRACRLLDPNLSKAREAE